MDREPTRFTRIKEVRAALQHGDEARASELARRYDMDLAEPRPHSFKELFTSSPGLRRQLIMLPLTWYFYGCAYVATNTYIVYWLTGAAIWTGLIGSVTPLIVWGILAVALSCGQSFILLCREIPSSETLEQAGS